MVSLLAREERNVPARSCGREGKAELRARRLKRRPAKRRISNLHETCADEYGLARGSSVSVKHLSSHTILISAVTGSLCKMSWD